mmetsp:Transcript_14038/g.34066  ORF Transcript_14038/g.34066 Transcript_14038/m.34066 type:complete len:407 (+) Transcript_14038:47-1267(+)
MDAERQRKKLSVDKIVAIRSAVLPVYVLLQGDSVTISDEVSANDFFTTEMHGDDRIAFRSYTGRYISTQGGEICSTPYCGEKEIFTIRSKDYQYAFEAHDGRFFSVSEKEPFVRLNRECTETELFQCFSLMIGDYNVGKLLQRLEEDQMVKIPNLLSVEQMRELRDVVKSMGQRDPMKHELVQDNLITKHPSFAKLVTRSEVLTQIVRRVISPRTTFSHMRSVTTDPHHVRKEVEETMWSVTYPFSQTCMYHTQATDSLNLNCMVFLDDFNATTSSWAYRPVDKHGRAPLPGLCDPEMAARYTEAAKPVTAVAGSAWLCMGPVWMTNTAGAASFWKEHDALTRYKHVSGQNPIKALTNGQDDVQPVEVTVLDIGFVRDWVVPAEPMTAQERAAIEGASDHPYLFGL